MYICHVGHDPADFDLKAHLANSFGIFHGDGAIHVVVHFSPTVARYVEESSWHASQKLTPQADRSLLAEFDLSNTEEIKRWLLSFGRHAEVIKPIELRDEIIDEARAMQRIYDDDRTLKELI